MGDLLWPNGSRTIPRVSSEWGMRWHPIDKVWRLHGGIDLIGWSTVCSPVDGVVIYAGYNGGFGNLVKVREDGTGAEHWLAHNRSFLVGNGTRVRAGQGVAIMGTTGASTGVHCHHEVHPRGGASVNPRGYYTDRYATPSGGGNPVSPAKPATPPRKVRPMLNAAYRCVPSMTLAGQARLGGAVTKFQDAEEWTAIAAASGMGAHQVSDAYLNGLVARVGEVPPGLYDDGTEPLLILALKGTTSRYGSLGITPGRAWPLTSTVALAALQRAGARVVEVDKPTLDAALVWSTFA